MKMIFREFDVLLDLEDEDSNTSVLALKPTPA